MEGEVHKLREGNDFKDKRIKELETTTTAATTTGLTSDSSKRPSYSQSTSAPTSIRHEATSRFGTRPTADEPLSREVGRMNTDRNGVGRFMGSSSGIFFIGTAQQRFASTQNLPNQQVGDALLRVDIDDQSTEYPVHYPVAEARDQTPLPPKEVAERYIDIWFDTWKHIFPILHRQSFTHSFHTLYSVPGHERERSVLALFYLLLALGCRQQYLVGDVGENGPTLASNEEDVEYYIQSSKYHNDILALNNLTTLQYQELQTIWFLYTGKRSLAFQMTGSMTRLALELGLHRHTRRFEFNPLEVELRKRVFWVCYMLDKYVIIDLRTAAFWF